MILLELYLKFFYYKEYKNQRICLINIDIVNDCKDKVKSINVSFCAGTRNIMYVCSMEVPNETAPSIQGFAKPPA